MISVESMKFMIYNAEILNKDIGSWEVNSVKNMENMFILFVP